MRGPRVVSNTPQQALTLLNDPAFVEAARLLAARLLGAPAGDDGARLQRAFQLAVAREPQPAELGGLRTLLATQRGHRAHPAERGETAPHRLSPPRPPPTPVEHAAWTQVARVLLNLQTVARGLDSQNTPAPMTPRPPAAHDLSVNRRTFLTRAPTAWAGWPSRCCSNASAPRRPPSLPARDRRAGTARSPPRISR